MAKGKFYVVFVGRTCGIFKTWAECEAQVKGYKGASYKSYNTEEEAEKVLNEQWATVTTDSDVIETKATTVTNYIENSISVDAACSGNPGKMEYKLVNTKTNNTIYTSVVYPVGTNNIGEFLAIVHALRMLSHTHSQKPIYSDSVTAIAWVRNQKVNTTLPENETTAKLWTDIRNAEQWLQQNTYSNTILKWETKQWGESKADFGRK